MLLEEHRMNPGNSMISCVDALCKQYKLPRVSEMQLDKGIVKRQIKLLDKIKGWVSNILSPVTNNVGIERVRLSTNFHKLSKRESQALLAYNAGAWHMKTSWGDYHEVQSCLAPLCDGRDELQHIQQCPFYTTKWKDEFRSYCKLLSKYLVGVDKERRRRYKGECLF